MTKITKGEAMPKNLTEALALDLYMEQNWRGDDEAFETRFHANLQAIDDGAFPIATNTEAVLLLEKLQRELKHSNGKFVEKIICQVSDYLLDASTSSMVQVAE